MAKPEEREQARELRKRGQAIKQIARELRVSSGSVHLWVKDIPTSREMKVRLAQRGHQKAHQILRDLWTQRILLAREQALQEWPLRRLDPDFMFGLALYLGEGYKTGSYVGMTNSDPALLRSALRFFQQIGCDMQRVRAGIHLHQGEDPEKALQYWSQEIGIPQQSFNRVVSSKVSGGKRARHLVHGTGLIRVSHVFVKRKLNLWMDLARQEQGSISCLAE